MGACFRQVQRFGGAAVGHLSLAYDMGLVDMTQGYVRKWRQLQAVKVNGQMGRIAPMGHEDLDPAV